MSVVGRAAVRPRPRGASRGPDECSPPNERRESRSATWLAEEVDRLVDKQRIACLWFLRPGSRPTTTEQRILVLRLIGRHGDLAAFRRAAL